MKRNMVNGRLTPYFWRKVIKTTTCWLWVGHRNPLGYGMCSVNQKTKLAYRLTYEDAKGKVPQGLVLDHLCRNPPCVNPDHLEAVTHQENVRRGNANYRKFLKFCKRGHAFTPENTIVRKNFGRKCRLCVSLTNHLYYTKNGNSRTRKHLRASGS